MPPFLDLLLLAAFVIALSGFRVAQEYERGVVFQLGRFWMVKGPGLIVLIPAIQQMVRVDLRTVVLDDHADSAANVTRLARVADRMPVAAADAVAGMKARRRIGRHRRRGAAGHDGGYLLRLEATFAEILIGLLRCFAGCQFLRRHQAGFHEHFLQADQPVFIITVP